jgi:beta-glucanase (GH16 family)
VWFEASIWVPDGIGLWPAWWLLGPDETCGWPECGEIDQGVHSAHHSDRRDVAVGVLPTAGNWHSAFHRYAMEWRPHRIDFFIDQIHTGVVTQNDVEDLGGTWPFASRC